MCPDELYTLQVKAEGGNAVNYAWAADVPASTGLALAGDRLTGKFRGAPNGATHVDFTLIYGALSAPLVLLLWFYCIGSIFLFGAEYSIALSTGYQAAAREHPSANG